MGHSAARRQKRRPWLVVLGGILGLAWIASAIMALGFLPLAMNYFPLDSYVGWDSYNGDYLVGLFQIWALQAATLTGLSGGFLTGFGLAPKRRGDKDR